MNFLVNDCSHDDEPTACPHAVMCIDCRSDWGCRVCYLEARDELGVLW